MQSKSASLNIQNKIKIINLSPCNLNIEYNNNIQSLNDSNYMNINQLDILITNYTTTNNNTLFKVNGLCKTNIQINKIFQIDNNNLPKRLIFYLDNNNNQLKYKTISYDINNQKIGFSLLKFVLFNINNTDLLNITMNNKLLNINRNSTYLSYDPGHKTINVINISSKHLLLNRDIDMDSCASYTVLIFNSISNNTNYDLVLLTDIYPNGMSLFWQIIQIFVMTIGEIMFSISGLSFAYSQVILMF
jgi:hypothetical protein